MPNGRLHRSTPTRKERKLLPCRRALSSRFSTIASRYWRSRSIRLRHGCKYDAVFVTDETKLTAITEVRSIFKQVTRFLQQHTKLQQLNLPARKSNRNKETKEKEEQERTQSTGKETNEKDNQAGWVKCALLAKAFVQEIPRKKIQYPV